MTKKLAVHPMNLSPRCGAKTRRGTECKCPAMANGKCKLHGGKSTGAPGNKNAWRHGLRSAEMASMRAMARAMRDSLKSI